MRVAGITIAIIGSLLLFRGTQQQAVDPVAEAFGQYEAMWRVSARKAAEALEDGDLASDVDVHAFLSEAGQQARRKAFQSIADAEQVILGEEWTPEKHAAILRGYAE